MISEGLLVVATSIMESLTLELTTSIHSIPLILLIALSATILIKKSLKAIDESSLVFVTIKNIKNSMDKLIFFLNKSIQKVEIVFIIEMETSQLFD